MIRIYEEGEKDKRKYCCPNCGAAIEGDRCEYCGTAFVDFACIDADKPFALKIKQGDKIYICSARLISSKIETDSYDTFLYADDLQFLSALRMEKRVTLEFIVENE